MAVFRAQYFFEVTGLGKWTNVYHISADSLIDARDGGQAVLVPSLLAILHPDGVLHKLLVSDPLSDDFSEVAIESAGTSSDSGSLLALFNCIKVLFQPADLGRPDIKFIKGYLTESLQVDGMVEPTAAAGVDSTLTTALADMLDNGTPLCSQNGALWGNVSVQAAVQMRQLHRRRRRTP